MKYLIVREDQVEKDLAEKIKSKSHALSERELVGMNAAAAVEIASGNLGLNLKLYKATQEHVDEYLQAEISYHETHTKRPQ
jgi:hypothetical protein